MPKLMFATSVVMKVLMWALIAVGLYLAVRLLLDGRIGWALLVVFVIIPVALWGASLILALANLLLLYPIALITGRKRQMAEYTNFQLAVADEAGADRLNLRQGRILLRMYEELPPPRPGEPARSGDELVALYNELHPDNEQAEPESAARA